MHVGTVQELLAYKLGSALTMEHDSLAMLADLEQVAVSSEVKGMFAHHANETREQIQNLQAAFDVLSVEPKEKPSPTTKGLAQEGHSLLGKVDEALRDSVALAAANGNEHYEIASYRGLISIANSLKLREISALLSANLEQEEHTSKELEKVVKVVLGAATR